MDDVPDTELGRAINAMSDRKQSLLRGADREPIYEEEDGMGAMDQSSMEEARALTIGFDIDYDELINASGRVADVSYEGMRREVIDQDYPITKAIPELFASLWMDGVLTGIMLMQQRKGQQ